MARSAAVLDFNFQHGTVITTQYAGTGAGPLDYGITIQATTLGGAVSSQTNTAIVYDSELGGTNGQNVNGGDQDLERLVPDGVSDDDNGSGWDGGNLGTDYIAGGLLIVQENSALGSPPSYGDDGNGDPVVSASNFDPDDRAAGGDSESMITFIIDSSKSYNYFQLTLADLEESADSWSVTLTGKDDATETFLLGDLIAEDPSITQGNNHINSLPESFLLNPEVTELAKVEINFGSSSGAISNIIFSETPIPEPSAGLLVVLSYSLLYMRRSRK